MTRQHLTSIPGGKPAREHDMLRVSARVTIPKAPYFVRVLVRITLALFVLIIALYLLIVLVVVAIVGFVILWQWANGHA